MGLLYTSFTPTFLHLFFMDYEVGIWCLRNNIDIHFLGQDGFGGFKTIHDRHLVVHKNQFESMMDAVAGFRATFFEFINSDGSIAGFDDLCVCEAFEQLNDCDKVEFGVFYNHYFGSATTQVCSVYWTVWVREFLNSWGKDVAVVGVWRNWNDFSFFVFIISV